MKPDKVMSADEAIRLIEDGDTVGLIGGGLCEATVLHQAVERRFLEAGLPLDLTCVHALGIGDRDRRGMNCFAHKDLVKRVIGGHWVWSPRMQEMARNEDIEAYVLPGGVVMQLMREIAAGRPGLFTDVGLGTFVDPRQEGGKLNARAQDDLVEVTERAVFRLAGGELRLEEIAPGVDLKRDILGRMVFQPVVADDLKSIPRVCFEP